VVVKSTRIGPETMVPTLSISRKCPSPTAMIWSAQARRIDLISLSVKPFCQGEPGAMDFVTDPFRTDTSDASREGGQASPGLAITHAR
jgi:hypothetical protein